jgi:hypothetical protein
MGSLSVEEQILFTGGLSKENSNILFFIQYIYIVNM